MRKFIYLLIATMALAVGCEESYTGDKPTEIPYDELPNFYDTGEFSGWSNARIFKDGYAIFTLNDESTEQVSKTFMIIPADTSTGNMTRAAFRPISHSTILGF